MRQFKSEILDIALANMAKDDIRTNHSLAQALNVIRNEQHSLEYLCLIDDSVLNAEDYRVPRHVRKESRFQNGNRHYSDVPLLDILRCTDFATKLLDTSYNRIAFFDGIYVHHPRFVNNGKSWEKREFTWQHHRNEMWRIFSLGYKYLLSVDVKDFYSSVNRNVLSETLENSLLGVPSQLQNDIYYGFPTFPAGLPLGHFFSDVLARFILSPIDYALLKGQFEFTRFQDDYVIGCKDELEVQEAKNIVSGNLPKGVHLSIEKSYAYEDRRQKYLTAGVAAYDFPIESYECEGLHSTDTVVDGLNQGYPDLGEPTSKYSTASNFGYFDHARLCSDEHCGNGDSPSSSMEKFNLRWMAKHGSLGSEWEEIAKCRHYLLGDLKNWNCLEGQKQTVWNICRSIPDSDYKEAHLLDSIDLSNNLEFSHGLIQKKVARNGETKLNRSLSRKRLSKMLEAASSDVRIWFPPPENTSCAEEARKIDYFLKRGMISAQSRSALSKKGSLLLDALS